METKVKELEDKLKQANDNIEVLVGKIVGLIKTEHSGHCLRVVLLNKDRICGTQENCDICNSNSVKMYAEFLLEKYKVDLCL